jgi:hypothetical protein
MRRQGSLSGYEAPQVVDYGTLVEMTASAHILLGQAGISDMSFSSPQTPSGGGEPGGAEGPTALGSTSLTNGSDPGGSSGTSPGGSSGSSGGGSSGGGGGHLPFTGLAAGVVGVAGTVLTTSGAALRRAVRRRG